MVLPQAISKATGLREVLKILRLSSHNTVGVGDAENDHELLKSCEYGVAVGWGSKVLQAAADYVLPGEGPGAVAEFLLRLASEEQIAEGATARRSLLVGHTDAGVPFSLSVSHRKMLIAGDTKSGKSWIAGLLCEQLILFGYSLLIIDPEGDYVSLETLPGVIVYGGVDPLPRPRDLIRALRHADVSVVIDLSHTEHGARLDYVQNLLQSLRVLRERTGLPHYVVLDEAHYFLNNQLNEQFVRDLRLDFSVLVSYRASQLHPSVLEDTEAVLITRESNPQEIRALCSMCSRFQGVDNGKDWLQILENLTLGETAALTVPGKTSTDITRIHLAPRLTPHVRHIAKYVDIPVAEKDRFVFWANGGPSGKYARTLRQLVVTLESGDPHLFENHLRQHDFSRWIADVFGDYPLAKTISEAEGRSAAGGPAQSIHDLIDGIRIRYDLVDPLHDLKQRQE